ncbi:prenyltransferase/squalene oxidase repeat-containing protein [Actinomadura violacea]|uniref:Squalene cyclase C-terminal domain-containing protein n=1 Tax=Actinomadura violacea TaxID=2819934 RepID=A0ABS3RUT8_9ACTN|nr:prenyltransferase/squalene oxidase repeat-containing protein [Actinomadura violacea]MBO2460497.1 hypothetical protein [Actinomadura violacea]
MTVEEAEPSTASGEPPPDEVAEAANALVGGLVQAPWGTASASVYETGRVVGLAPWLTGHVRRLRFLLDQQRADGGWGPPDAGYALVPTLSATDALLSTLVPEGRPWADGAGRAEVAAAAERALRLLGDWLDDGNTPDFPDMPAIEHITPSLIEAINGRLDRLRPAPSGDSSFGWSGRLRPPAGMDGSLLPSVRKHLAEGGAVPVKLLHALEIAGPSAYGATSVRPVDVPAPPGRTARATFATVGASAAATAAWLGTRGADGGDDLDGGARRYLEAAARQWGGPVPVATPITNFERGWVLGWLARAGIPLAVPSRLIAEMQASLGEDGAPGGPGLPPDADTSSGVLYALSLLNEPVPPDLLWRYEAGAHFSSWPGEDGRSVTTNAHVLEAFGHYARSAGAGPSGRYAATARKVASWLVGRQDDAGRWTDRWHASPLYATACCALALDAFGGPDAVPAVDRAIGWVIREQRADGSWGRWDGTAEETAYAVQILTLTRAAAGGRRGVPSGDAAAAVRRGDAYLRAAVRRRSEGVRGLVPEGVRGLVADIDSDKHPLWHDKDLYRPITIVRAAVLGALHLARSDVPVSTR